MLPDAVYHICSDNGIELLPSNVNCYEPEDNTIKYCSRLKGEQLLFTVLHEIGHALQYLSGNYDDYFTYTNIDKITKRNRSLYIYYVLSCEYDAWERGRLIAKTYNINFNQANYIKYAASNTDKYIKIYFKDKLPR